MPTAEQQWNPNNSAIWQEKIPSDVPGKTRAITLRHPTYPFRDQWTMTSPEGLLRIAAEYLRKVAGLFELPANLFVSSSGPNSWKFKSKPLPSGFPLTWLPIGLNDNLPGPRASFWINRYGALPADSARRDRTALLLAVQAWVANDEQSALGSRLGIRIVAHVSTTGKVRITGSTCSADLARPSTPRSLAVTTFCDQFFSSADFRSEVKGQIRQAAGLGANDRLWLDGLRVRTTERRSSILEMYANVQRQAAKPSSVAYALTGEILFLGGTNFSFRVTEKCPLSAHAAPVNAKLFPQDPASQAGSGHLVEGRPNRAPNYRSPYQLERFRHVMVLPGLTVDGAGNTDLLDDLLQAEVMQSKLVNPNANESLEEVVNKPDQVPHARTNPFAALSGYQHARELFDTMRLYGLEPVQYFRLAALPLHVRYRATITPGPGKDGRTVNAMVDYDPPGEDYNGTWSTTSLEPLQVRFALADLKRSVSRREPLGLAADPRWSWHEYGHVLLAASSAALELQFVHSAGDALAAILWDPPSALAGDPPPSSPPRTGPQGLRMATFPWVYLNRRHDRSVYAGWSWCGTYHRRYRFGPGGGLRRRKGYHSEQILSTSLFRVYRVLGGDTVKGVAGSGLAMQWAAADYTAYLIMQALAWVGPTTGTPPATADQLVSALTDGDIGTAIWQVPHRDATLPLKTRVGGCAYKVVRWAFEAQGLYATSDPLAVVDAPGTPPDIDIFIDNRRPDSEGAHPRGGYMPVSLDWDPPPNGSRWLATDDALNVVNNKQVFVKVRNRGQSSASGVVVQVWYTTWPAAQPDPPLWNGGTWTKLGTKGPLSVPAGGWKQFGPFKTLPTTPTGNRLLIFAEATCPGDRANSDPTTGFPCSSSTQPTSIVDLVTGDNNLGLKLFRIP